MIKIIDEDESIKIEETLSFEHHLKPIYNDIREDIKYDMDENYYSEKDKKEIESFLNYELNHQDKIEILDNLIYEYEKQYDYENTSVFDEDIIKKVVKEWITDKYYIESLI